MEIKEHKRTFQLERMILFSDAVFAIAITLLVIELKLPEFDASSNDALTEALRHTIPHFISFIISFMIIGIYWMAHHRMFSYVIDYDRRLLWLNLMLLFFIALMPFSSNVYGVHAALNTAYYLYVFNILMLALFNFLIYAYISKPGKHLSHGLENRKLVHYYQMRAWVVPLCFFIGAVILMFSDSPDAYVASRLSPILILPAIKFLQRKYKDVIGDDKNL